MSTKKNLCLLEEVDLLSLPASKAQTPECSSQAPTCVVRCDSDCRCHSLGQADAGSTAGSRGAALLTFLLPARWGSLGQQPMSSKLKGQSTLGLPPLPWSAGLSFIFSIFVWSCGLGKET